MSEGGNNQNQSKATGEPMEEVYPVYMVYCANCNRPLQGSTQMPVPF